MVAITKDEKNKILERFPKAYIVRTMKQKSKRHHYFCEEYRPILRYLNRIRNNDGNKGTRIHRQQKVKNSNIS